MSISSWQNSLRAKLAKPRKGEGASATRETRPYRIAILGIGNELRGDDAAGVIVARELSVTPHLPVGAGVASSGAAKQSLSEMSEIASVQTAHLAMTPPLIIDAGAAPEAFTGQLRRFAPDHVIMIDAAQLNELPGTIRLIEWQDTIGLSASTHTLPLNVIAQYLVAELGCEVAVIGVQSSSNAFDAPLSPAVRRAASELIDGLRSIVFADRAAA